MTNTLTAQLADFTAAVDFTDLPEPVVTESKRILLDSIGCAVAAVDQQKGWAGIDYGRILGGASGEATIMGTPHTSSVPGAAFANGELINTLDFDAVLPPGHVTPYVLPGALGIAETRNRSGRALIEAIALSHEMSFRFYKSMDYLRDMKDGEMSFPPVIGYSNTVFGAAAAVGRLDGLDADTLAHAIAIAGSTAPVNSQRSWTEHAPTSTIKYLLAGALTNAAIAASYMAKFGHRGDLRVLDDADYGFRRFIGSRRWEPQNLTDGLGTEWLFPTQATYKPYPHCRILHGPLHALNEIVTENQLRPDEITAIRCWGEAAVFHPMWMENIVELPHDAQFVINHGLAVGAHGVTPSKAWHDPELVFSRSVLDLSERTTFMAHPDYMAELAAHPSARPTKVEVDARGTTFVAERRFPKGSPSPDPSTRMTDNELIGKFRVNAAGVLDDGTADKLVDLVYGLDDVDDVAEIMRLTATR